MKISLEDLEQYTCKDLVQQVQEQFDLHADSNMKEIEIVYDRYFESTGCKDQTVCVAFDNIGFIYQVRYWKKGSIDIERSIVGVREISFFYGKWSVK